MHEGKGVRINYLDYWCEELREVKEGTEVKVRYDPFDISIGYVYLDKQWRICHATCEELVGCSEREKQILTEEIRNRTGVSHVLVGTYAMRPFRKVNAQLALRSIDVHFRRYDATKDKEKKILPNR